MRRLVQTLLMCGLLFPQAGCWDRAELTDVSMVIATAIDRSQENWQVAFQVILPQGVAAKGGSSPSSTAFTMFETSGRTLQEAVAKANLESPRSLFMGHNQLMIIGEQAAKYGVSEIMDFLLRNNEIRETTALLLTHEKVSEVMQIVTPLEKINAVNINGILESVQRNLTTLPHVELYEVINQMQGFPVNTIIPSIKISGNAGLQSSSDALNKPKQTAVLKAGDIGIFKKDKLVAWIKQDETPDILLFSGELNSGSISFSCSGMGPKNSSFLITKGRSKLKSYINDDNIRFVLKVQAEGRLGEINCSTKLDENVKETSKLQQYISEELEDEINQTFEKVKALGLDPLGLGHTIEREHSQEWKKIKKQWPEKIKEAQLEIHIRTKITQPGLIENSFENMLNSK